MAPVSRDRLERRRRAISRIALYGSLVLSCVLATFLLDLSSAPLVPAERTDWERDWEALEEVRLLRDYVRIDTSASTGDAAEGARFLSDVLAREGIEHHLEILGTGDANLWAILEGEQRGAVVLHHHIDVSDVPDPEGWPVPPFEGRIEGPWLHGRGTFDMKSIGIAQLTAFLHLARSGVRPERSVILLATSGEETGSELGTRWVLEQHPELVERFDVVLTEGGVVEGRSREEIKYWGTEFAQKRFATLVVCDPSRERLLALRRDLFDYGTKGGPERLVDEARRFLPEYAPTRDRQDLRRLLSDPERLLRDRGAFETLPGYLKAMFRTEIYPLTVRPAGGAWELRAKLHMLPGDRLEDVREAVLGSWLFHDFEASVLVEPSALHGSSPDHPDFETIVRTIRDRHPGVAAGPIFLPWTATDSRFFRARAIPSFGFSPFVVLTTDALRVDGAGERISLPDYAEGVALYREILDRLTE